MSRRFAIPNAGPLEIEHLLLDANGTLTDRGELIAGVKERLATLASDLDVLLISSDTRGTLEETAVTLGVAARKISTGTEKRDVVIKLGRGRCAAIGNGANDIGMVEAAALGIAVIGPEGASARLLSVADVVVTSPTAALDLLLEEATLASTLRP